MHNLITFLDGGFGTMLQKQGIKLGHNPGLLCLEQPEAVTAIHRQYVEAGSRILYANTFSANRLKLEGTGHSVEEIVTVAIGCAKDACRGTGAKVALDIGPIGQLMRPMGSLSFDQCYDIFKEMCVAGENAGADLIAIETMTDLQEARAALLADVDATWDKLLPLFETDHHLAAMFHSTIAITMAIYTGVHLCNVGLNAWLEANNVLDYAGNLIQVNYMYSIVPENPLLALFMQVIPYAYWYMYMIVPILVVYLGIVYLPEILRSRKKTTA